MNLNICVNGTFRYPDYIKYFEDHGVLNAYYYAHRISTQARALGIPPEKAFNIWPKEYLLHSLLRFGIRGGAIFPVVGDLWQAAVILRWRECDSVQAVLGGLADRVLRFARRQGCAIVGHYVNSHPMTMGALVAREYECLGLEGQSSRMAYLDRRLAEIELCDHIVVDSQFVRRSFLDNGYPAERITVLRPGANMTRFTPRRDDEIDRKTFRVVCVAAISARKGQRYLLEAWRKLDLPYAELVLVGDAGGEATTVLRGFEGAYRQIPRIPNAQLRALLVTASAFVLPSIEDGFGQSAVEALSCGVPVIVTDHCGVADVIEDGQNGFVVPARNADVIADVLSRLHADRNLAEEIGARAGAMSLAQFSWADHVEKTIDIHRSLTARRAPANAEKGA